MAPWPAPSTCGVTRTPMSAHAWRRRSASATRCRHAQPLEPRLAARHRQHEQDAGEAADRPRSPRCGPGLRCRPRADSDSGLDQEARPLEVASDQARHQRAGGDRRHGGRDRVGAEHHLEAVEGTGQGCAEGGRDGARRPAGDQQAEVGAPRRERHADPRRDGRTDLCITGLEPQTEAPKPQEATVWTVTSRLPLIDRRPPNSALASIASASRPENRLA